MELALAALIQKFAVDYTWIMAVVSIMGMARLILKPLMVFLHDVVVVTETQKDDDFLKEVEASKIYKAIVFVLDYVFSLKLKKK